MWRIICCERVEIIWIILILANPPPPNHHQPWQMTNVSKHSPDATNLFNVLYCNMDKQLCNSGYLLALVCIYCNFYGALKSHWLWLWDTLILNSVTGSTRPLVYYTVSCHLNYTGYTNNHTNCQVIEVKVAWPDSSKSVCPIPSSVATFARISKLGRA